MINAVEVEIDNLDFVYEWSDRWFRLADLLINVLRTDKPATECQPPSVTEANTYTDLHQWLISHEQRFCGLWQQFYEARLTELEPENDHLKQYWQNPFAVFYRPQTLRDLFGELAIQVQSNPEWCPNEDKSWEVTVALIQLGTIVVELFNWTGSHVPVER